MPDTLNPDITLALTRGDKTSQRILELVSRGSTPDLNEQCKFIIAQDAFKTVDEETNTMKLRAIKLASLDDCVIVRGESGTGKELIANILHGARKGNFVAVNMTAVTDTLFESELFGHVKGAFTGATENRAGLISHANDGTLFFDEIGDMPITLQPKLLRIIQTRKYRVVGSNAEQPVRCRIVAATHTNLEARVESGIFRSDLYYRLATFQLFIKPLRERLTDINEFISNGNAELRAKLKDYTFPGNVRELESIVKRWEVFHEININQTNK